MKLLIIGFVWPEPNSSAAGSRMMQLIQAFGSENCEMTFASTAAPSRHAVDLEAMGLFTKQIKLNHSSFDRFINDLQPDAVLFDRFMTEEQFGWRVAEQCPDAFRILDTEDLHSLRKTRQDYLKKNESFTVEKWMHADITKREIASIYRSDLSLIISAYEMQLLCEKLKIDRSLLYYLPFLLDPVNDSQIAKLPSFAERQHFVTIGNFRHEPNLDSIVYLKETIWPMIKKVLPGTELHIYGSYPNSKATQLNNIKDGFMVKGWADSVDEIMKKARVCLAPLRFGAGIKGKFIDAMKNGTPSITTNIGAEGIEDPFGGFIADDPKEIAYRAVELYSDSMLWKEKQEDGFKLLQQFEKSKIQEAFLREIDRSREQIQITRHKNFIGALLQHHTMQGHKYMSKWIEEKNMHV